MSSIKIFFMSGWTYLSAVFLTYLSAVFLTLTLVPRRSGAALVEEKTLDQTDKAYKPQTETDSDFVPDSDEDSDDSDDSDDDEFEDYVDDDSDTLAESEEELVPSPRTSSTAKGRQQLSFEVPYETALKLEYLVASGQITSLNGSPIKSFKIVDEFSVCDGRLGSSARRR